MWRSTVFGETRRDSAIARLDSPAATSSATSRSRAERAARPAPAEAGPRRQGRVKHQRIDVLDTLMLHMIVIDARGCIELAKNIQLEGRG